jgi:hypothetical protein
MADQSLGQVVIGNPIHPPGAPVAVPAGSVLLPGMVVGEIYTGLSGLLPAVAYTPSLVSAPLGLAATAGPIGTEVPVINQGPLTLSVEQWNAVIVGGDGLGLQPDVSYYCAGLPSGSDGASVNAGMITSSPPSPGLAFGAFTVPILVGVAINPTTMMVRINTMSIVDGVTLQQGGGPASNGGEDVTSAVSYGFSYGANAASLTQAWQTAASGIATVAPGTAMTIGSDGHQTLAKANELSTAAVCGLSLGGIQLELAVQELFFISGGLMTLTAAQWAAVAGGDLVPGDAYYLSAATAGQLTTESGGTYIGIAMSTTTMLIQIGEPTALG